MKQYYAPTQIIAIVLLITAICVTYLQEMKTQAYVPLLENMDYVPLLENMEQNPVHIIDLKTEFE